MASSHTYINTLQMQPANELEHTKRFIIDVVVELTKVKNELLDTIVEFTETKERLRRTNILIRKLAIPTTPRFSTPSHPHLLALPSNLNPVPYSSTIHSLNLCYGSLIFIYCCRIQEMTVFDSKAAAPTEEDIVENTLFFHEYHHLLDITQHLPPDPSEYK